NPAGPGDGHVDRRVIPRREGLLHGGGVDALRPKGEANGVGPGVEAGEAVGPVDRRLLAGFALVEGAVVVQIDVEHHAVVLAGLARIPGAALVAVEEDGALDGHAVGAGDVDAEVVAARGGAAANAEQQRAAGDVVPGGQRAVGADGEQVGATVVI